MLCYCADMKDENRSLLDERREDRAAYKKGVREGWDQAVWLIIGIAACIVALTW